MKIRKPFFGTFAVIFMAATIFVLKSLDTVKSQTKVDRARRAGL